MVPSRRGQNLKQSRVEEIGSSEKRATGKEGKIRQKTRGNAQKIKLEDQ